MDYPDFTVKRNPVNNDPVIVLDEIEVTAKRDYTGYAIGVLLLIAAIGIRQRLR